MMQNPDVADELVSSIRQQLDGLERATAQQRAELQLIEAAVADLEGAPLRVLVFLRTRLDFVQYRDVKLFWLVSALRRPKGTISKALKLLVRRGYLEAGPHTDRRRQYRLRKPTDSGE